MASRKPVPPPTGRIREGTPPYRAGRREDAPSPGVRGGSAVAAARTIHRGGRRLLLALAAVTAIPSGAGAQPWTLDVGLGRSTHRPEGSAAESTGLVAGVRHEGPYRGYLTTGIPYDREGVPWAAAGLDRRVGLGRAAPAAGLDLGAHLFGYRDRLAGVGGGGLTVEAMPLVAAAARGVRGELRSGALHHSSAYGDSTDSRTLHASDLRLQLGSAALQLFGEGRYWRGAGGAYPYLGGGAHLEEAGLSLWARAGQWLADDYRGASWGAGVGLAVTGRTSAQASVQRDPEDPLYRNPARTAWSLGLGHRLGRPRLPPQRLAVPAPGANAGVTFRLSAEEVSGQPAVGGDFNRWEAVPMTLVNGYWTTTLPLAPGVYHYGFRRPDGSWFVPAGAPGRRDDGFGGTSAVLIVP